MPRDCSDIQALGQTSSGVYTVYISDPPQPMRVYCDMTTDGGGWLVCINMRVDVCLQVLSCNVVFN